MRTISITCLPSFPVTPSSSSGRTDPNDPVVEHVEQIARASTRAAALTRQLLAFSRRQSTEQKDIVLNDVVTNVERMLRRLIGADVDLVLSLDEDAGTLRADPGQIEQIIVNLVINARDAMPNGGRLSIETAAVYMDEESAQNRVGVEPGRYVMLSVTDTGTGMSPEVKSRIFEPFFTTKERGKGTGLGLSTVYGIVQQSRGSISVQSQPGKGTTFRLHFPSIQTQEMDLARTTIEMPCHGNETILLTEDEAGVRGYVRHVLERHGYRVVEASNGLEAIDIVHRLQEPDSPAAHRRGYAGDGRRGTRRAVRDDVYPGVPVLYMSGYNDRLWMEDDSKINFIQKPFSSPILLARIRQLLDAYRDLSVSHDKPRATS